VTIAGLTTVVPVIYPRLFRCPGVLVSEEGQERGLGLDGDDAVVVESGAAKDVVAPTRQADIFLRRLSMYILSA
jgi:hypothetical protein